VCLIVYVCVIFQLPESGRMCVKTRKKKKTNEKAKEKKEKNTRGSREKKNELVP